MDAEETESLQVPQNIEILRDPAEPDVQVQEVMTPLLKEKGLTGRSTNAMLRKAKRTSVSF